MDKVSNSGFHGWFRKKYILFRGEKVGREGSVANFARWLPAPRPLVFEWLKEDGKIPTSEKYIRVLFDRYGDEFLEILGVQRPREPLSSLPPYLRRRLQDAQREIENNFKEQGITGEMPEAESIARVIMEKHGFRYKITREVPDEDK